MKYQNFTCFSSVEILWKRTAIYPKLCPKCVFSQNFHTWKLGEITLFYAVECRKSYFAGKINAACYQIMKMRNFLLRVFQKTQRINIA